MERVWALSLLAVSFWIAGCSDHLERGILVQKIPVAKRLLLNTAPPPVTHLQIVDIKDRHGLKLAVFNQRSMYLVDPTTWTVEEEVKLERTVYRPEIVQRPRTPGLAIASRGALGGYGGVGLMDFAGARSWWRYDHRLVPADLDGDDELEFYGAGPTGLCRMDGEGTVAWRVDGEFRALCASSTERAPRALVAATGDGRALELYDANGHRVGSVSLPIAVDEVESAPAGCIGEVLVAGGDEVLLLDRAGTILIRHRVQIPGAVRALRCALLQMHGSNEYLAVLTASGWVDGRSVLTVFSAHGEVLYEKLFGITTGVCVYDAAPGVPPVLLIGGPAGEVFEYSVGMQQ